MRVDYRIMHVSELCGILKEHVRQLKSGVQKTAEASPYFFHSLALINRTHLFPF